MRWWILFLAALGLLASAAALHEHYHTGTSPCSINERWDCGLVNHSRYAVIARVPVAAIGVLGYALLMVLGVKNAWRVLLVFAALGMAFSLYLAYIEAYVLEVWCLLCVCSLAMISLIAISTLLQVILSGKEKHS